MLKNHTALNNMTGLKQYSNLKSKGKFIVSMILFFLFLIHVFSFPIFSQEERLDINLDWIDGDTLPPSTASIVDVTITNRFGTPVNLNFVGIRFDWMDEGIYLYGEESEKTHELASQDSITFSISFTIPEDVEAGPSRVYLALVYLISDEEVRQVIQVEPPLNIIDVVTVTYTETALTTVYEKSVKTAIQTRTPSWVPSTVAVAGGLAFILFIIYMRMGKKREKERKNAPQE